MREVDARGLSCPEPLMLTAEALKKGNDELTEYMDGVITELKESGRLDELKEKWGIMTDEEVQAAMQ